MSTRRTPGNPLRGAVEAKIGTARIIAAALFVSLGLGPLGLQAQEAAFKVVVNESNPTESLTREQVSRLFLKKSLELGSLRKQERARRRLKREREHVAPLHGENSVSCDNDW